MQNEEPSIPIPNPILEISRLPFYSEDMLMAQFKLEIDLYLIQINFQTKLEQVIALSVASGLL